MAQLPNYQLPTGIQPSYPMYQQPTVPAPPQQVVYGMNWVQGPSSVKSIQQIPNTIGVYFDSDNENIHYIKVTDALGRCTSLAAYRSEEIPLDEVGTTKPADTSNYITKDELPQLIDEIMKQRKQNFKQQGNTNKGA